MAAYFCPRCAHCQDLKEIEEAAEKRKQEFDEEVENRRKKLEEELKAEKRRIAEGVIYGNRYDAYSVEEIMKISNLDFLYEMSLKMCPSAQPPSKEEFDELIARCKAVETRLNDVLIENLEWMYYTCFSFIH